jgi:hypothetical protein
MKTQYIRIGIIILILIGLAYLFYTTEGFQIIGKTNKPVPGFSGSFSNVTGKSETLVVKSSLQNLTDSATLTALGNIETGSTNPTYAVIEISDYTGKSLWSTGMAKSTNTTPNQYQLKFKSPITTTKFQEKLPTTPISVSYVGLDFTSPFIIVQKESGKWPKDDLSGTLWNLTDKYYLGILKTIGDGVSPTKVRNDDGTYTYPFDVESIENTNGTNVWKKDYLNTSRNPNMFLESEKGTNMFNVNFSKPISLSSAKQIIRTKTIFNYVGLKSTDTPDLPIDRNNNKKLGGPTYYNDNTYLSKAKTDNPTYNVGRDKSSRFTPDTIALTGGDTNTITADNQTPYTGNYNTITGNTSMAPTSEGGYVQPSYRYPTYQDPAAQPTTTSNNLSNFGPSSAPSMKTNRVKVRAMFKTIILPVIIKSLETGSNAKLVEIINETGAPVWPATTPPYEDSGMPEVFTIGFDKQVDVQNTIKPYIEKFIPSITYLNPAMPRT